ncbi:MAG: radical SAM family heme chaperone HemW [Acidobacteriaceae bacterium]
MDDLGLYLSIPFCRAKCTFCNFASDAFAPGRLPLYIDHLCREIAASRASASRLGADLPHSVDTLYFGGGTPSLLSATDVRSLFGSLRQQFRIDPDAEITAECAPNQIAPETLEALQRQGVNRLSFGVQSFVDRETSAIGRLHTAAQCLAEIERVRSAGILNLSLDLIAGLPHQNGVSWQHSVQQAIESGVPHISVYMLELDEDSRLGREVLADGQRYSAANVPDDDASADFYELACDLLGSASVAQYEISNFARPGFESIHNLRYWQRRPYLGLGLDAHSMLRSGKRTVRFSNTDDLDLYLAGEPGTDGNTSPLNLFRATGRPAPEWLTPGEAFEETVFLGLRRNAGLRLPDLRSEFGNDLVDRTLSALAEAVADGLLLLDELVVRLTPRGRVLSNEVFRRLLLPVHAPNVVP